MLNKRLRPATEAPSDASRESLISVSECVCGTVARVVYSRQFPDWIPDRTKSQSGRL